MFDGFFRALSEVIAFFYSLTGDYAAAIALLTLSILIVFTPITVMGSRSMAKMSQLQPLMKKIQNEHKGDRFKAQQEMSQLYRQYNIRPLAGCLPLLLQLPVFFMLYQVIRGLSQRETVEGADTTICSPKYIGTESPLYQDIVLADCEMRSLGMDLARSANDVVQESFVEALPYLGLVALMVVLAWLQQFQAKVRRQTVGTNPQMEMVMKIMPFMLPVFSFIVQSGLTVYFGVSSLYRLAQQEYIHRTTKQIDLDAGPLVREPETPKPVPHQRSQKAIDAEADRRAERAKRSAQRRGGGEVASRMGRKPPAQLPPSGRNGQPSGDRQTDDDQVIDGQAIGEQAIGERAGQASPNDQRSGDERPKKPNKRESVVSSARLDDLGVPPTPNEEPKRRSLFGRSRDAKANGGPTQPKPIQSRRTSGDGRRRNTRKKK